MRKAVFAVACLVAAGCSGGGGGGGGNHAPIASPDTASTDEDTAVEIDVLANDEDADGDTLSITGFTDPADGTAVIGANGRILYTPDPEFSGGDSLTYTLSDGGAESSTASVTITVLAVGDAPLALADEYSTPEDSPLVVTALAGLLGNDADLDSATITAAAATQPSNGTLALSADGGFTYTPDANFAGVDSFTYVANDGALDSATVTVTLTVSGVDDAPVAGDDSFTTEEDVALDVAAASGVLTNDLDIEQDELSSVVTAAPANGVLTLEADGGFLYTPNENFEGTDSFTYLANAGALASGPATVTLTVTAVNDAPVAGADSYNATEDEMLVVAAPGVLENDSDIDSAETAMLVADAANGTVSLAADGGFTYVPDPDFNGSDSFTYRAVDGQLLSADTTVSLTVANVPEDANIQIATVRATPDGSGLSLLVERALVTYVKPEVGAEPAGFFIQKSQAGPAIFVESPLAVAVGDEVDLVASDVATVFDMKRISGLSSLTIVTSGNSVTPLVQDLTFATDLTTNIDDYESELVTIDLIPTGPFTAGGSFWHAATSHVGGARVRLAGSNESFALFHSCEATVTSPLWRMNAFADATVWTATDLSIAQCYVQFNRLVVDALDPLSTTGPGEDSLWTYDGELGQAGGEAMCQAVGADRVCDYDDLRRAELLSELTGLPEGQTIWLNRFQPVTIGPTTYPVGPGGRCNEWTLSSDHLDDGEFATVSGGTLVYTLDPLPCYTGDLADGCAQKGAIACATGNDPGGGTFPRRAIACCFPSAL